MRRKFLSIGFFLAGITSVACAQTIFPNSKNDVLKTNMVIRTLNNQKSPDGQLSVRVGFHNYDDDKDYVTAKNDTMTNWSKGWQRDAKLTQSDQKYKLEDIQDTFIRLYMNPPTSEPCEVECTLSITFTDGDKVKTFKKIFSPITITADTAIRYVEVVDKSKVKK
ncbi:hypothetical protein CLV59_105100 [Chitinophaga dinghuensis]|uniref:Uncharacterized protein n=1 Tax=Chitinophaga dinghuensis TaxID=1539050 RepID=A0A327VYW3_9BACT|nr:hypothetical protein [Chitinophaga dinghuensis]RAJ79994.1 hypothetical protein CLV59_105100 [Chitinophaga dinghuensis]